MVKALKAHVCRCTGYARIVDAVLEAATALREHREVEWETATGIGKSVPKLGAYEKALGISPFVDDLRVPGMLYGALLFSAHPRARVLSLDWSAAEALPGVVKLIGPEHIPGRRHQGLIVPDWPMYVKVGETTRYIGDVLCCVVAENEETAREALELIRVEYEELEPITSPREAMDSRVKLHPGGNLLKETVIRRGRAVDEVLGRLGLCGRGFLQHSFCGPRLFGNRVLFGPARSGRDQGLFTEPGYIQRPRPDRLDIGSAR